MKSIIFSLFALFFLFPEKTMTYKDNFSEFKASLKDKKYVEAYKYLHSSMEMFWKESPLILNNVRFVVDDDNSFGIYTPRVDNKFSPGEKIYLYMEPIGYSVNKNKNGLYEFGFTADFTLEDEKGTVLGGQKGFADLGFKSWNFNTELSLTFTYSFSGFDKGKYKIVTDVHDKYSDKTVQIEKWFYIR